VLAKKDSIEQNW